METINLEVTQGVYSTAKAAREADRVPIVYYGNGVKNQNFSADYQEFRRAYKKGGRSTIMHLVTENKKEYAALIHDMQYDPVTDQVIHVDMLAIDLNKPIHTQIPLVFTGIAPAVKELSGVLVHNKDKVAIECLPKNLVHEIEVDISSLADFHSSITVGDIIVPETIKILDALDINVVSVSAPRAAVEEEEETVSDEEGEAEEGEKDDKKEEKGEEGGEKKE